MAAHCERWGPPISWEPPGAFEQAARPTAPPPGSSRTAPRRSGATTEPSRLGSQSRQGPEAKPGRRAVPGEQRPLGGPGPGGEAAGGPGGGASFPGPHRSQPRLTPPLSGCDLRWEGAVSRERGRPPMCASASARRALPCGPLSGMEDGSLTQPPKALYTCGFMRGQQPRV